MELDAGSLALGALITTIGFVLVILPVCKLIWRNEWEEEEEALGRTGAEALGREPGASAPQRLSARERSEP